MRKWLLSLILLLPFLLAGQVLAQTPVTFTSLKIDIRPEYDRPSVLVIYDIELPPSALGSQISLRIPESAGAPFALAYGPGDGSLFDLQYTRQVSGEWAFIDFSPPMAFIRLEFYDPDILMDSSSRSFNYVWPGDYAINELTVMIMQPWSATGMKISPGQWESRVDSDGLTIFRSVIGPIPQGEEIELKLSYQKSTNDLTTEHLIIQASESIPEPAGTSFDWQKFIPWVLGILGAAMLGGGLFWYWHTGRQEKPVARNRHSRTSSTPSEASALVGDIQSAYCHQCGNRTSPSDLFCRACGTRLRSE